MIHIIGGGLTGIALAKVFSSIDEITIYEKTDSLGGLCKNIDKPYTNFKPGLYGEHIFHTDNEDVASLFKSLFENVEFYEHRANIYLNGEFKEFPINKKSFVSNLMEKVFLNYSKKQWGTDDLEYLKNKIARVKPRDTFDDRYFKERYQYIPKNNVFDFVIPENVQVKFNTEMNKEKITKISNNELVLNTSNLDDFYDTNFLKYRSLEFEFGGHKTDYFKGKAITINYPSEEYKYTRVHNYEYCISYEFPREYIKGKNLPMYPSDDINITNIFNIEKIKNFYKDGNIYHLGRLGSYQYMDMDKCLEQVLVFKEYYDKI